MRYVRGPLRAVMSIEIGSTVEGTVVRIVDYGVLVRLPGGVVGLVHISEIADAFVRDVHEYFKENDRVLVKIVKINDKGRYVLSTKQADADAVVALQPPRAERHERDYDAPSAWQNRHDHRAPRTFEERLSRFMKESEERLMDLKRHMEAKRSHGKK